MKRKAKVQITLKEKKKKQYVKRNNVLKNFCDDELCKIFGYCDTKTLVAISSSNKKFQSFVLENQIQKQWTLEDLKELIQCKNVTLALQIIQKNWIKNLYHYGVLQYACIRNNVQVFEFLLKHGEIDLSQENIVKNTSEVFTGDDDPLLLLASDRGHDQIAKLLLEDERIDPNVSSGACLFFAVDAGYIKVVELFLKDGRVDFVKADNWVITHACIQWYFDIVTLLSKDSKINPFNKQLKSVEELKNMHPEKVSEYFESWLKKH